MNTLQETIKSALNIRDLNSLGFVTIWKHGASYGFNFDNKPIGYSEKEYGIRRTVIEKLIKQEG